MTLRFAIAAAAALLCSNSALAEPAGFLAQKVGDVDVMPRGSRTYSSASVDDSVALGDTIRTGRDSMAKLLMSDDTTLTLGDETELRLDRGVVNAGKGARASGVELLQGRVRSRVVDVFGGATRFELRTPTAVIGVKGTEWHTWHPGPEGGTWICVSSGVVKVRHRNTQFTRTLDVSNSRCAVVPKDGAPRYAKRPESLEPVDPGRKPGGGPDGPAFPAKDDPWDQTPIENNDVPGILNPGGGGKAIRGPLN